jgi:CRP-like cAMP-binding protein
VTSQRLSELGTTPEIGEWFDALRSLMNGGDPPVQRFGEGEAIMRAGEVADRFFVIVTGTAEVLGASDDEHPLRVEPNALLGELGVLFGGHRRRTVVATSPVIAIAGTRSELERALEDPRIGAHVASLAARRLAERVQPIPATTSKGLRVLLHPLRPIDRQLYIEALGSLSLESLRTRFFAARRPPDSVVERLINIDYIDHVAWVCVEPDGARERPLGIARFIVSAGDAAEAEIAIGIVDAYQGRGLGRLLVGTVGCVGQARGLETFTALVLADNHAMRAVFDKAKATWKRSDMNVLEARMRVANVAALLDPETALQIAAANREVAQAARLADA